MQTQYLTRPDGKIAYDVNGTGPLVVAVPSTGRFPRQVSLPFAGASSRRIPHSNNGRTAGTASPRPNGQISP